MDPIQDDLPLPMVAVRTSTNQNSLHAEAASSSTGGKAIFTTAQDNTATDAETSGAQAQTPGGQERQAPVLQSRAQEPAEDDDGMTVKSMQQTSKITEMATIAEGDTRTIGHNRAPARVFGDAGRNMVQSIASATKLAKQSIWGPPSLIWNTDEATEGDETLVRKLEEQLNAVKQRLSMAGSTTSGAMMNPSVQRRASGGASENELDEHERAGAEAAPQVQPPPPPDDNDEKWLREKRQRDVQRELARVQRERDEQAAVIERMQNEHRLQMELAIQQSAAQKREHILEQQMLAMQAELRIMQARNDDANATRENAERTEEMRRCS